MRGMMVEVVEGVDHPRSSTVHGAGPRPRPTWTWTVGGYKGGSLHVHDAVTGAAGNCGVPA